MKNVITFGTFDLFHYGHLRILERAASLGDKLIVGVSSDSLNFAKKHRYPIIQRAREIKYNIFIKMRVLCIFRRSIGIKKRLSFKIPSKYFSYGR
ncbi:adenylyltransferase/cytidyltransferase family protein [Campylobacter jejuni]|uniref:adenylyltransferase/cytidyltransferase family protein n=1 Tax=Campylobacter jejuni TaxID=197 RepID=UPI0020CE5CA1|nr:adenylyltransferase/cytidyltransferase family protein [Campylobacter jejuni]